MNSLSARRNRKYRIENDGEYQRDERGQINVFFVRTRYDFSDEAEYALAQHGACAAVITEGDSREVIGIADAEAAQRIVGERAQKAATNDMKFNLKTGNGNYAPLYEEFASIIDEAVAILGEPKSRRSDGTEAYWE